MRKPAIFLISLLLGSGIILTLHFCKPAPETTVKPLPGAQISPEAGAPPPPSTPDQVLTPDPRYRIAIIIDDLGFNPESTRLVLSLNIPMTVSVLPFYPYSKQSADQASRAGMEVLLHIPMEPVKNPEEKQPGKGVLLAGSAREEIERRLAEELAEFPAVSGASSHMGSLFTTDPEGMRTVLRVLKRRNLFFVDNLTTNKSVTRKIAGEEGIKYFLRDVFIDNDLDRRSIIRQLEKSGKMARKGGWAIAVGHPHSETIQALQEWIPDAKTGGITFVRISELLSREK